MGKLLAVGLRMFGIGIIGLAVLCFITKDFIVGRPPASVVLPAFVVYLSASLTVVCGIAIVGGFRVFYTSLVIAAFILLFSVLRHIPQFMNDWLNAYKALAIFGGSLIAAASVDTGKRSNILLWIGTILLSIFFIACGYAHVKFYGFVKEFIPAYIPFRGFFAYFTAVCLFAGGIGILIPFVKKWAAVLSGTMLLGWFVLLHIPRFLANTNDASDRMGLCESFTFAAIFFILSGIFAKREKGSF